jgi:hypothetical protein
MKNNPNTMGHDFSQNVVRHVYYVCKICKIEVLDLDDGFAYWNDKYSSKISSLDITCDEVFIKRLLE